MEKQRDSVHTNCGEDTKLRQIAEKPRASGHTNCGEKATFQAKHTIVLPTALQKKVPSPSGNVAMNTPFASGVQSCCAVAAG